MILGRSGEWEENEVPERLGHSRIIRRTFRKKVPAQRNRSLPGGNASPYGHGNGEKILCFLMLPMRVPLLKTVISRRVGTNTMVEAVRSFHSFRSGW